MPLGWGLGAASGAGSAVLFLYTLLEFPIFFFFNDKLIIGKKANNNFFFLLSCSESQWELMENTGESQK